ncbi:MAG: helicase-exonuclease AddAB subunit AddA [Planctomycetes bacterium]|nr:helicase-exonuclease AddAB subunit AddA [Planctomycetota bacterium]
MAMLSLTTDQRNAVEAIDRSVLVSAAAGSGKTAVLARRCVHLICDAPPRSRCNADELLVLTFTEAAASEMRERIIAALRDRAGEGPGDPRIGLQMRLVHSAQISTVHAFCLWMIRRWFEQAGIDPTAPVMSDDEARLLRVETLDALLDELYASDDTSGREFRQLVEVYGLGRDRDIARLILDLDDFLSSLPDPSRWLDVTRRRISDGADQWIAEHIGGLSRELGRLASYGERVARHIDRHLSGGAYYGQLSQELVGSVRQWQQRLTAGDDARAAFERVRAEINDFKLDARRGPRLGKDAAEDERRQRDQAKDLFTRVRDELFIRRIQDHYGHFDADELRDGLRQTSPHVEALTNVAAAFRERYRRAKESLPGGGALDFSDLERRAYDLLTAGADAAAIRQELQRRFAHVLVDEFQDINPLQEAILRAVSREDDADRPDNLFVVGDVKQSIYRFRLAEPQLFLKREQQFDTPDAGPGSGSVIRLQKNFRSDPALLDGINAVFKRLMRSDVGGIAYDERAALHAGRAGTYCFAPPIEVHLLERRPDARAGQTGDSDDPADGLPGADRLADPTDPWQWRPIEREAFLIGQEIRRIIARSSADDQADRQPIDYSDIVILLRSVVHAAGPLAATLRRMGIPTWTAAGTGLLAAPEIRDVRSLLEILDNPQQDIPLAAVLRSGVLYDRFDEDDLIEIRAIDRDRPFHAAVRQYASAGKDDRLREQLGRWYGRLNRFRREIRRRPLPEVLWQIYRETGFLDYVGGLSNGRGRRANLIKLHDRARQFSTLHRQGLHRFLRFLESLEADDRDLASAATAGEGENVVRVMTIHAAKGLEFPAVFVAGLARSFNMRDSRGRMIFERELGLGLRVVDRDRMIEYPSVAHMQTASKIENQTRAEELRTLYVAMTRAEEKLFLIGSTPLKRVEQRRAEWRGADEIDALTLETAQSPLDWLVPALASMPADQVRWSSAANSAGAAVPIAVRQHTAEQIADWPIESLLAGSSGPSNAAEKRLRQAVTKLDPLPSDEPLAAEDGQVESILDRLEFVYPNLPAASVGAVMAASEAKRRDDPADDLEHQHRPPPWDSPASCDTASSAVRGDADAGRRRGTATHTVLEHLDFNAAGDAAAVGEQVERLVRDGLLAADDAELVDVESIAWFVQQPLGQRIRHAGPQYRREFMFIASEPAETFDPALAAFPDERVLVRGVVDGLIIGDRMEIIDFKTDRVDGADVANRAAVYASQVRLYARAMERIWRRPAPADACSLVFLDPRVVVTPAY